MNALALLLSLRLHPTDLIQRLPQLLPMNHSVLSELQGFSRSNSKLYCPEKIRTAKDIKSSQLF